MENQYTDPEIIPILIPTNNLEHRTIEAADEVPGIISYYSGDKNLNVIKVNCDIYANPNDCYNQSTCGWCGALGKCVKGSLRGPIDECPNASFIFSLPQPNQMNPNGMISASLSFGNP